MNETALALGEITENYSNLVGGKAWALSKLIEYGIRIPSGLCITTSSYRTFILETGLEDDILLIDNSNTTTSEILGRTTKVNEEEMRGNEIYTVNPIDGYENLIDLWSEDIWDLGDDSVNSHSYPSLYWQKE